MAKLKAFIIRYFPIPVGVCLIALAFGIGCQALPLEAPPATGASSTSSSSTSAPLSGEAPEFLVEDELT